VPATPCCTLWIDKWLLNKASSCKVTSRHSRNYIVNPFNLIYLTQPFRLWRRIRHTWSRHGNKTKTCNFSQTEHIILSKNSFFELELNIIIWKPSERYYFFSMVNISLNTELEGINEVDAKSENKLKLTINSSITVCISPCFKRSSELTSQFLNVWTDFHYNCSRGEISAAALNTYSDFFTACIRLLSVYMQVCLSILSSHIYPISTLVCSLYVFLFFLPTRQINNIITPRDGQHKKLNLKNCENEQKIMNFCSIKSRNMINFKCQNQSHCQGCLNNPICRRHFHARWRRRCRKSTTRLRDGLAW
jgi:hypothetical protein